MNRYRLKYFDHIARRSNQDNLERLTVSGKHLENNPKASIAAKVAHDRQIDLQVKTI